MATKNTATRKPRVSKVNPNETPRDRFTRLATARTNKAIKAIASIGKLNGKNYAHTGEDVKKIEAAITSALESATVRLAGKSEAAEAFKL